MKLDEINLYAIGDTVQMIGAVYAGDGHAYLCLFPEDRANLHGEFLVDKDGPLQIRVLDMDHEDWKRFMRQSDLMEVEILQGASDGTLAKAILRKSNRQIDQHVSWRVYRRDQYACRYCGREDVPLTVDHLVTWEDGGPSVEENLVASCKKCNKTRGSLPYEDWLRHEHYLRVSRSLRPEVRRANQEVAATLASIPRMKHVKSR